MENFPHTKLQVFAYFALFVDFLNAKSPMPMKSGQNAEKSVFNH
ncbi:MULTISPECIES: hypothetical protein [Capnocytophaga]|nr:MULTISPECIES: hypothetical protein [Capnocytophaga]